MKTIEYKVVDCNMDAPESMNEYYFEKALNELAEDRWEPLIFESKFRVIMARTIDEKAD